LSAETDGDDPFVNAIARVLLLRAEAEAAAGKNGARKKVKPTSKKLDEWVD